MRRAAAQLTSLASLVFLPSLLAAKVEPMQEYKCGLQDSAVLRLPRASQIANPRSAAPPVQLFPTNAEPNAFAKEFYGMPAEDSEAPVPAELAPITEFSPNSTFPEFFSQPE